tara:strand:+ start:18573 stop:20945 length:2373 start_codon:yes stop_codon:yes gene_type:complete
MPKILLYLSLFFISPLLFGQGNNIIITGKILEQDTDAPVEFATVAVINAVDDKPITGATTSQDGTFNFTTSSKDFYVEVSFIGFKKKTIRDFTLESGKINLGSIYLSSDSKQLDEIVVEGQKSSTEFKLDKRVFNLGSDLRNTGASALEVLNNVPSVNVTIQGQIQLRGSSGVQVLINGKPSVIASDEGKALGTITASMIDYIEVITNPSAKYDAEGTSGIINIVLKKEERRGTNGSISINTGNPASHSVGFSLNHRTENFNLFTQIGVGYGVLPDKGRNINSNYVSDTTIYSSGTEFRNELYYNVVLGTDYYINENNVITVSGSYALEIEDQPSTTYFRLVDEPEDLEYQWKRTEITEAVNPKYQFEANFKRDFEDHEDHDLIFSAIGRFFGKEQSSDFEDQTISGSYDFDSQQKTETNFDEGNYTFKLDYARPFSEIFSIEAGGQYLINDVGNDFAVRNFLNGEYVVDSTQTNLFEYDQDVLAAYGTGGYEINKWGLKLGVRVENTVLNTLLVNTNEANYQNYTNLFPSAHTSYKLNGKVSLQAGYSRRIYRPRLWDLNPFFNIRNNFSIRKGNPDLLPEFTDSYEVSTVYNGDKTSLNFSLYHRYTTGVIERISFFENNVRTTSPQNIGTSNATGIEINGKYDPVSWLTMSADFNYNYFSRYGALEGTIFDFSTNQWSSKLNTKIKLPADITFEIIGYYRSGYQTVQSEISDMLYADTGLRKKIMNGKGVINVSVRDLFASRIEESVIDQSDFYLYSYGLRGRFVAFGFSYGFGKGEAMQYGGKGHR